MGRRVQEFNTDALSLVGSVAEENHPAFLLFFGDGINERELDAHLAP